MTEMEQLRADVDRLMAAIALDGGACDIPVPNAADKVDYAHQRIDNLDAACEAEAKLVRGEITKAVERASETMYEQDNAIRRGLNDVVRRLEDLEGNASHGGHAGEIEAIKEHLERIDARQHSDFVASWLPRSEHGDGQHMTFVATGPVVDVDTVRGKGTYKAFDGQGTAQARIPLGRAWQAAADWRRRLAQHLAAVSEGD